MTEREALAIRIAETQAKHAWLHIGRSSIVFTTEEMGELVAALRAESGPHAMAIEALEFASGAIYDALGLDDGLDAAAGQRVLSLVRDALEANGKPLPPMPGEDESSAERVYTLEGFIASLAPQEPRP